MINSSLDGGSDQVGLKSTIISICRYSYQSLLLPIDVSQSTLPEECAEESEKALKDVQAYWQAALQQELRVNEWKQEMDKFCKISSVFSIHLITLSLHQTTSSVTQLPPSSRSSTKS